MLGNMMLFPEYNVQHKKLLMSTMRYTLKSLYKREGNFLLYKILEECINEVALSNLSNKSRNIVHQKNIQIFLRNTYSFRKKKKEVQYC